MGCEGEFGPGGGKAQSRSRPLGRHKHLTCPERLSKLSRTVIGLRNMGFWSPAKMADAAGIFGKQRDSFRRLCLTVMYSREPIVMDCIRNGLPRGCGAELPEGVNVVCKKCHCRVNIVPCQRCAREGREVLAGNEEHPLVPPERATKAKPGTSMKVLVMAARVARGEQPFHPSDPYLQHASASIDPARFGVFRSLRMEMGRGDDAENELD